MNKLRLCALLMTLRRGQSNAFSSSSLSLYNVRTTFDENVPMMPKKLFTPGPIMTSRTVKEAMLADMGSRDNDFLDIIQYVKERLLQIAGVSTDTHTIIIMQGSGTFGVESVIQSSFGEGHTSFLIVENGAYGARMATICERLGIQHHKLTFSEESSIDLGRLELFLSAKNTQKYTHVGVVHSETSTGVLNKIELIGPMVKQYLPESILIVDAVSSFGAIPIDLSTLPQIDFLVSAPNKCLEAVPGFSFVICSKQILSQLATKKSASQRRSLSLDLDEQYRFALRHTNQFRFTPPVHALLACRQALIELDLEGGPTRRLERYTLNHEIVRKGLVNQLGLSELVSVDSDQSKILNSFLYPESPNNREQFAFDDFYDRLSRKGMIIYPGKVSQKQCFRIANIGHLFSQDMFDLVACIRDVLGDMRIRLP